MIILLFRFKSRKKNLKNNINMYIAIKGDSIACNTSISEHHSNRGGNMSATGKTYHLLTPKHVPMMCQMARSYPITSLFEKDGGIYIGPAGLDKRYAKCESKWFHRPSLLGWSTRESFLFDAEKYEQYIKSRKMWKQLPELYGRIIACWCKVECCSCQVSALKRFLQQRIKEDFPHVDEERYVLLKQRYALSQRELKLFRCCLQHPIMTYSKICELKQHFATDDWEKCGLGKKKMKVLEAKSHNPYITDSEIAELVSHLSDSDDE